MSNFDRIREAPDRIDALERRIKNLEWLAHGDGYEPEELRRFCYLPMDCPSCGRRRLEWDGKDVICEKCGVKNWQDPKRVGFTGQEYRRGDDDEES